MLLEENVKVLLRDARQIDSISMWPSPAKQRELGVWLNNIQEQITGPTEF